LDRQDDIFEDDHLGDGDDGGIRGRNDDCQVPEQSISEIPPAPAGPPQQPPQPRRGRAMPVMPPPRASDDTLPPISAHLSKLGTVLASKTADGYLTDFQQTWGSRLPGPGAGVASVRPGGHMQRETLKRKAAGISRSAAETYSFACLEDLSERAGDRLLTFTTNVICMYLRKI